LNALLSVSSIRAIAIATAANITQRTRLPL